VPRRTAPCPQLEVQKQPLPFPRPPVCVPYLQIGRGAKGRGRAPSHSHGPDSRSPERANGGGGRKKGGGRFRVCARATARVHPYGWHPLPIPARPPPGSHVAPTRNSEGSEQPGLGVAYSSLDPFACKWRRGPLPCPPSVQTRGGMHFRFACGPHSHAPFAHKQRRGAKGFIHSCPPPPIHVSPLHASQGWGRHFQVCAWPTARMLPLYAMIP